MKEKSYFCEKQVTDETANETNILEHEANDLKNEKYLEDVDTEIAGLVDEIILKRIQRTAKSALKRECSKDLKALLKVETKDTLKEIMNELNIEYKSADKKDDLIDKIAINYEDAILKVLKYVDTDCYISLQKILKNNGIIPISGHMDESENSIFMQDMGMLYIAESDDKLYLCAPEQVLKVIPQIDKKSIEKNDEIIKLFRGMIYYYGGISAKEFMERLPEDAKIDLPLEEVEKVLAMGEKTSAEYIYEDSFGLNGFLCDIQELEALKLQGLTDDYKQLTKTELLKASRRDYIGDKNNYKKFIKVIKDNYDIPGDGIEQLLEFTYETYQLEGKEELIKKALDHLSVPEFLESEIINAIDDFCRKIPAWKYNGYTDAEKNNSNIFNIEKVRVGRNDPCPCGSGKKYKKCCESKGL
ncbi:SEC-C metal-binding domain-containing protein [Clostridium sp. UBA7503]|uniref:SEC-C metal-binding domain-containing protein n=1 Tax=Clostridium sp. UBA7503 TaxID=1946377 RepID=UPI003216B02E